MTANTAAQLQLRPPTHRVDHRARWLWALQSLLYSGALLIGSLALTWWLGEGRPWMWIGVAAVAGLFIVAVVVEPFWRYAVHRWEVTDDAVYALTGWIVREWRVAPMSRIQTVDAVRGPIEQALGLSTLRVTTASSKGAIDITGLDKQTAAEIAEKLTLVAQLTPGDAT